MNVRLLALATTVAMGLSATAPAAQDTLEMGYSMLTGAVYNILRARNLPTDGLNDLTLTQIVEIKAISEGDDSEGQKTQRIEQLLNDTSN